MYTFDNTLTHWFFPVLFCCLKLVRWDFGTKSTKQKNLLLCSFCLFASSQIIKGNRVSSLQFQESLIYNLMDNLDVEKGIRGREFSAFGVHFCLPSNHSFIFMLIKRAANAYIILFYRSQLEESGEIRVMCFNCLSVLFFLYSFVQSN